MGPIGRFVALAVVAAGTLWPLACSGRKQPSQQQAGASPVASPVVRVRLTAAKEVRLRASAPPTLKAETEAAPLRLNLPADADATLVLANGHWVIGGVAVPGSGTLALQQADDATLQVNGRTYRGHFRFIPTSLNEFDVINDVDVDSYLKGVIPRELFRTWEPETYKAQAIIARTYALYETQTAGRRRHFDVFADQRSQVYGGTGDETAKSIDAVDETAGIVVAYGPGAGEEKIFKTYFSACCGGVTQSGAEAFNEPYLVPLSDQNAQGLCSAADHYNWGPVEITKDELTRRLRDYKPELRSMARVSRLEIQSANRFNRPTRFVAIDADGQRYSLSGEELRVAVNRGSSDAHPARLLSSFVKTVCEPGSDVIRFIEGHGNGHGVGMCQWCSEIRADAGMRHEDIVLSAYPRAKLVRAY